MNRVGMRTVRSPQQFSLYTLDGFMCDVILDVGINHQISCIFLGGVSISLIFCCKKI